MFVGLAQLWSRLARLGLLESIVAALLTDHLLQILLMAMLSAGHELSPIWYRVSFGASSVAVLVWALRISDDPLPSLPVQWLRSATKLPKVTTLLAVGALLLALYRASFFFDTTYDSLTYSLPRLAFYAQEHSIFFLSGLPDLRIDANERNGELAFLHQLLLTGDIRWLALGGVICWLTTLATLLFLLRAFELEPAAAGAIGVLVASSPIVFGLSAVTKGDLFSAAYLTAAMSWLLGRLRGDLSPARLWLFWAALCLAVTCKLTAAFAAAGAGGFFAWDFLRRRTPWHPGAIFFIAATACLTFSKAIQNIIVYHHPFQRNQFEAKVAHFSFAKLYDGLADFPGWFLGIQPDSLPWDYHDDLAKGLGLVALALIVLCLLGQFSSRSLAPCSIALARPVCWLAIAISVSALVALAFVPVRALGFEGNAFRYLLPYVLPATALAFTGVWFRLLHRTTAMLMLGIFSGYHLLCATTPSPTFSHYGRQDLLHRALHYDRFDARYGYWKDKLFTPNARTTFANAQAHPTRVLLILESSDLPLFWLFGNNLDWHVTSPPPGTAAATFLAAHSFDLVSVATARGSMPAEETRTLLANRGWTRAIATGFFHNYVRP